MFRSNLVATDMISKLAFGAENAFDYFSHWQKKRAVLR